MLSGNRCHGLRPLLTALLSETLGRGCVASFSKPYLIYDQNIPYPIYDLTLNQPFFIDGLINNEENLASS